MSIIQKETFYCCGETRLRGVLVYDADSQRQRPGIVLAPNMMGITESNREHAVRVAQEGYIVLIADLYGSLPATAEKASAEMNALKDTAEERNRMKAALQALAANPLTDASRLGAIGFCYGGHCVLELARSGAPLRVTVCIHGTLSTQQPAVRGDIRGQVLVLNGAGDPFVSPDQIAQFSHEMASAGAGFQLVNYAGAVHSFTYPRADIPGKMQYNENVSNRAFRMAFYVLADAFL
ncbi:dienelactone hydrolase family protein [Pantoea sp. B550]|uniref:dienelactone hydrolase family protein n=1 Tax=Pantoea TaxID=53335 RepID=UPI001CA457E0|nr:MULTISPECIES: dienelactone hydrolase family protein [Pantoea]MCP1204203.1 dienelactone hydrolase family protein [Pantoea sp. B550]QZX97935.1 dienelactone hydrolase family protein [Pantoea alfalfae]